MKLFGRKTRWERVRDTAMAVASSGSARHAGKITLGVVGGAVAASMASAAVSVARRGSSS